MSVFSEKPLKKPQWIAAHHTLTRVLARSLDQRTPFFFGLSAGFFLLSAFSLLFGLPCFFFAPFSLFFLALRF
jgi:hypothetical protein